MILKRFLVCQNFKSWEVGGAALTKFGWFSNLTIPFPVMRATQRHCCQAALRGIAVEGSSCAWAESWKDSEDNKRDEIGDRLGVSLRLTFTCWHNNRWRWKSTKSSLSSFKPRVGLSGNVSILPFFTIFELQKLRTSNLHLIGQWILSVTALAPCVWVLSTWEPCLDSSDPNKGPPEAHDSSKSEYVRTIFRFLVQFLDMKNHDKPSW